ASAARPQTVGLDSVRSTNDCPAARLSAIRSDSRFVGRFQESREEKRGEGIGSDAERLALRVLEAGASAALTVLLTLLLAVVTSDEARLLERGAQADVDQHERAGDAVAD